MPVVNPPARAAFIIVCALSCAPAALADPITDQIDAARRAYESGEPRVAIQALQFAATQIEEQLARARLGLLPEPLPGWTAQEASAQSGGIAALLTGTSLTRQYRHTDSAATVSIAMTADSPLLAMMNMLMSTPMLMQAEPGNTAYSFGGYRGMLQQSTNGATQISLMLGTRILLQLEGANGADQAMLEAYLKTMDFKAIERGLLG